ncbi:MAG: hypothetical protein KDD60_00985 [Bdellovibrionales bacterium]|nr:hypothetical protein [Bdellovibrionales bacterium]
MKIQLGSFKESSGGYVLPLLALLLASLLGFATLVYYRAVRAVLVADLQTAADAAALAAANELCSTRLCYEKARIRALEVLKEHTALEGMGGSLSLEVNPGELNEEGQVNLQGRNLFVRVSRMWSYQEESSLESEDDAWTWRTESLEGDWNARNPGLPDFVIANSVTVEIGRPRTSTLFSTFGFSFLSGASARSTALSADIKPQTVAPFALPICSLIGAKSNLSDPKPYDFNKENICSAPRYFTRTDRYCGNSPGENPVDDQGNPTFDPECGVRPVSLSSLCQYVQEDPSNSDPWRSFLDCSDSAPIDGREARFPQFGYANFTDHFGVVGLPDDSNVTVDGVVQAMSGVSASIGQRFYPLPAGLNVPQSTGIQDELEDEVWARITKSSGTNESKNNDFPDYLDLNLKAPGQRVQIASNLTLSYEKFSDDHPCGPNSRTTNCNTVYQELRNQGLFEPSVRTDIPATGHPAHITVENYRHLTSNGFCSSRRFELQCEVGGVMKPISQLNVANGEKCDSALPGPDLQNPKGSPATASQPEVPGLGDWNEWGNVWELEVGLKSELHGNNPPVWRVKVPVIADVSADAEPCEGAGALVEPAVNPTHDYRIVGFIRMLITDVSIGEIPMTGPNDIDYDDPSLSPPLPQRFWNGSNEIPECPIEGLPFGNDFYGYTKACESATNASTLPPAWSLVLNAFDLLPEDTQTFSASKMLGPNPWHFHKETKPESCNMVQAQVYCGADFIPSSLNDDLDSPRIPRLIE